MSNYFSNQDQEWLLQEMETNLYSLYQSLVSLVGGKSQVDGVVSWVEHPALTWPRTIYDRPSANVDLIKLVKKIHQKKIPPFWIMCRKGNHPLHQSLLDHGFRQMAQWPAMVKVLAVEKPAVVSSEISVSRLTNLEELNEWRTLVNENLMKTTPFEQDFLEKCLEQIPNLIFYGLKVDGKVVTTAMAYPEGKTIGLYMFSTTKEHRRKGYTSLLMKQILVEAVEAGYTHAFLQASAQGIFVYPKLGFQTIERFDIYWQLGVR